MTQFILKHKAIIAGVACIGLIATLTSFSNDEFGPLQKIDSQELKKDSVPELSKEKHLNMQEYDQLVEDLQQELKKTQEKLSGVEMEKAMQEAQAAISNINFEKMQADISAALKAVDFASIEKDLAVAMTKTDWKKINTELKASLEAARKEMDNIKLEEVNKELEKAKAEVEKSKEALKAIDFDKIMADAATGITAASEELKQTKVMFNEMEKDGLINRKEGFSIEYRNKTLYINGKKQNEATTEKYRRYIHGDDFKITIDKD
ncbi:MAG: hypothetical protein QM791_14830 [Ferruginibacter sp.]